jgi:hypothetical protein
MIHNPDTHKLGRKFAPVRTNMPRMANYIGIHVLPLLPVKAGWGQGLTNWKMFLNDRLGDCTAAGIAHLIMLWNNQWNRNVVIEDQQVQDLYVAITGEEGAAYNPVTGANDNGCVEQDVLTYIQKNGFAGHTIAGFAFADPKNIQMIKACIYLFGSCYVGVSLPISAQNQLTWDVTDPNLRGDALPGSWGGHCVILNAYDDIAKKFTCVTWGAQKDLTYAWWEAYGDEGWGVMSQDWLGPNSLSPNDFNVGQLMEDIKLV